MRWIYKSVCCIVILTIAQCALQAKAKITLQSFDHFTERNDLNNTFDAFFHKSGHTNNWAVLVDTSRFWFNYRHASNMLGIYQIIKNQGIPDNRIILMTADDIPCNPRNSFPGQMFHSSKKNRNLYGEDVEVDYRGYEVTAVNFIRLLTDRVDPSIPLSKRLLTDDRSNILLYMTGHGGDGFLKFQDSEEVTSIDLANAIHQMWQKKRYNEILFMIDTCQANTMFSQIYSPNVIAIGSSEKGQNSYSHENDYSVGLSLIDKFTYLVIEFFQYDYNDNIKFTEFFDIFDRNFLRSTPGKRYENFHRQIEDIKVSDFFESSHGVELTTGTYSLQEDSLEQTPLMMSDKSKKIKIETNSESDIETIIKSIGTTYFVILILGLLIVSFFF